MLAGGYAQYTSDTESKIRWSGIVCESRINALPYPFGSIIITASAVSKISVVGIACVISH